MFPSARHAAALFAVACAGTGCAEEDKEPASPRESTDRAVEPPPGWRTVRNRAAGFTVAAPRSWSARTRNRATVIRSGDRLVAMTLAADRSEAGRRQPPAAYARETLAALPRFQGSAEPGADRVPGSPYRSSVVRATGTVKTSPIAQRISVAVLQRPRRVTYSAVVFSDPAVGDKVVLRMLGTLRGRPPARQRSGRSG